MKQCPNCRETMSLMAEYKPNLPNKKVKITKTWVCPECKTQVSETNILELSQKDIINEIKQKELE